MGYSTVSGFLSRVRSLFGSAALFGGARDLYTIYGYKTRLSHNDFLFKYVRQDIATRIINAPVEAVWTDRPVIRENKGGIELESWKTLAQEHNIFPTLTKLDKFAGLGRYAVLLIGLDDGKKLDVPANSSRKNKILYLQPYLERSVRVLEYDTNVNSPRFNQPLFYEIDTGKNDDDLLGRPVSATNTPKSSIITNKLKVHYTRVLHIAENAMENSYFGYSRLQSIYNTLDDLMKITGGSAETYWLASNRGLHIDIDKEMDLQDEDAEALTEEIDEYQHQLRRVLRTRGAKVNSLGGDVVDPKGSFSVQLALLSANTGIPQRVLMGAEAGQLASQQDRANWAVTVDSRISNHAEPNILRPFISKLSELNILVIPSTYYIDWPDTFKMNPLERAQTSAQMARSAVNVIRAMTEAQKNGFEVISIEESREIIAPGSRMPIFTTKATGTFPPAYEDTVTGKATQDKAAQPDPMQTGGNQTSTATGTKKADPADSRPIDTRT